MLSYENHSKIDISVFTVFFKSGEKPFMVGQKGKTIGERAGDGNNAWC